eukprot:m.560656 g.560656  ORF g.560656 m.560656 type:complete len:113 (-) comp22212_c2_seq2:49-387(-)
MWQHDCSATADQEHGVLPHNMTQPNTLHRHTSSLSHTKWRHEHPWCSKIRITTGASVRYLCVFLCVDVCGCVATASLLPALLNQCYATLHDAATTRGGHHPSIHTPNLTSCT